MERFTNICEATSQSHDFEDYRPTHRKGKKLLAEKKRRARINNCLMQIKNIVCEGEDEKETDLDKMEKAEILERTLEVLTRLRSEHCTAQRSDPFSARKAMAVRYASGFSSCAEESIRYIQNSRLVPTEVKVQLQNHLRTIARRMETVVQIGSTLPPTPTMESASHMSSLPNTDSRSCCIPSPIKSSTPLLQQQQQQHHHQPQQHQDIHEVSTTPSSQTSDAFSKPLDCSFPERTTPYLVRSSSSKSFDRASPDQKENYQSPYIPRETRSFSPHQSSAFRRVESCPQSSGNYSEPIKSVSPSSDSALYYAPNTVTFTPSTLAPVVTLPPNAQQDQPIYQYYGYEPYPVMPAYHQSELPRGQSVVVSVTKAPPQTPSSTAALNLCLKPDTHQISPETMWRPW